MLHFHFVVIVSLVLVLIGNEHSNWTLLEPLQFILYLVNFETVLKPSTT